MKHLTKGKISAFAAVFSAVLFLAACGGSSASTEAPSAPGTKSVINITTAPETQPSETASAAPATDPAGTEGASSELAAQSFDESDLVLVVDGAELSLGMDFVPAADKILGGDYDVLEGKACVAGGNYRNYFYLGEAVGIYTVGGADGSQNIYDIFISLEGYATRKGAVIGQTERSEVLAVYGEPAETSSTSLRYSSDDRFELIFGFTGEILSSLGLHDSKAR